jgi:hypothetical protein
VVEAASFSLGELATTKRASDFYKGFSRKKFPKIHHILRKKGLKSPLLDYRFLQLAISLHKQGFQKVLFFSLTCSQILAKSCGG